MLYGNNMDIKNIKRVEWSNQPILLTVQLAEFYETSPENIKRNFSNNADRFVECKHYFKVEGEDLENLRGKNFHLQISPKTRGLYLWTERGAARHAKMLNTDKAWEVFEALEDNYFNRPARVNNQFAILDREWLEHERKRLAQERDDFAKAELLKEMAAAAGQNQALRSELIRYAAHLVTGKRFAEEIRCIKEI